MCVMPLITRGTIITACFLLASPALNNGNGVRGEHAKT